MASFLEYIFNKIFLIFLILDAIFAIENKNINLMNAFVVACNPFGYLRKIRSIMTWPHLSIKQQIN